MLISCWSVKGGSGTTVVAAALALALARSGPVTLADLGGDLPAALGIDDPGRSGLADWLAAGPDVGEAALDRIALAAAPGLTLLPRGGPPGRLGALTGLPVDSGSALAAALGRRGTVVVDCGLVEPDQPGWALATEAQQSLLVIRPCYLALRRAYACPLRPSGVVLVKEPGRSLDGGDVEDVLGVPVTAEVPWAEIVARAVDAGLLASRLPRVLRCAIEAAA